LQQHVKRQGRLSELEALKIIRDVADGYLALEDKKIVHRDLKTANIFLTPNGPRIADFGFCEFLNETKKPQVFYNVGSPAYMSPESYRDNQYTPKSDIWSIGITLYEMLVGETPDKNLSYSDMSGNLMSGRIANVASEEIKRILAACFKKDLKERCSAAQLLEAVNNEILRL
jgi:serine/threonine protein kinase